MKENEQKKDGYKGNLLYKMCCYFKLLCDKEKRVALRKYSMWFIL